MSGSLNATPAHFDIYGVSPELQKQIFSLCEKDMLEYDRLSQQLKLSVTTKIDKRLLKRHEIEKSIIKKVNTLGDYSFVTISTVNYMQNRGIYSTIDIVQKSESNRFPKSSMQNEKKLIKKSAGLKKLFQLWDSYFNRNLVLASQNKFDFKATSCPVLHCTWGFTKEELKNDLPQLKAGAAKYKNQLIDIVKYSNNYRDRADAIFILANTNDYHGITELMISTTNDPSEFVRNNSMRVLAAIVDKYDIHHVNIHNILLALNYPYVTDRNKAACVLENLVRKDKSIHPLVITESGTTLINLLKLKQPNNHDSAYLILKELSHKNYSERDYQHWQEWIDSEKNKLKKA